jgi:hypothetical protein
MLDFSEFIDQFMAMAYALFHEKVPSRFSLDFEELYISLQIQRLMIGFYFKTIQRSEYMVLRLSFLNCQNF